MEAEVETLWARYRESGDDDARQELILQYAPLVKYVAGRVGAGMPAHVDFSDLISYGMFGLIDAIERFEPERGIKFETYAIQRIRGSILDELRSIDWVPRLVRSRVRKIETAMATLQMRLQRSPTDAELAEELGITEQDLEVWLTRASYTSVVTLDGVLQTTSEDGSLADTIADHREPTPDERLEDRATLNLLREYVGDLPERERDMLALYYVEGLTLRQIGEVFGVTESRVCQIHSKAVMSLRSRMLAGSRG